MNSPYLSFINKKGTFHPLLESMFKDIDIANLNFQEHGINSGILIKA